MLENGIEHHPVTPHYRQANGLVENINKPTMKAIRTARVEHRHWHQALFEFLMLSRATPHSSTKFSPSQLLFNRPIRTKQKKAWIYRRKNLEISSTKFSPSQLLFNRPIRTKQKKSLDIPAEKFRNLFRSHLTMKDRSCVASK